MHYFEIPPGKKHVNITYFSSLQWSLSIWPSLLSSWNVYNHPCSNDIHS